MTEPSRLAMRTSLPSSMTWRLAVHAHRRVEARGRCPGEGQIEEMRGRVRHQLQRVLFAGPLVVVHSIDDAGHGDPIGADRGPVGLEAKPSAGLFEAHEEMCFPRMAAPPSFQTLAAIAPMPCSCALMARPGVGRGAARARSGHPDGAAIALHGGYSPSLAAGATKSCKLDPRSARGTPPPFPRPSTPIRQAACQYQHCHAALRMIQYRRLPSCG